MPSYLTSCKRKPAVQALNTLICAATMPPPCRPTSCSDTCRKAPCGRIPITSLAATTPPGSSSGSSHTLPRATMPPSSPALMTPTPTLPLGWKKHRCAATHHCGATGRQRASTPPAVIGNACVLLLPPAFSPFPLTARRGTESVPSSLPPSSSLSSLSVVPT